jgi:hypothetical protein
MKKTIWHPEEKDKQVNNYLARANHAPYIGIWALAILLITGFTVLVLMGSV